MRTKRRYKTPPQRGKIIVVALLDKIEHGGGKKHDRGRIVHDDGDLAF